jgi:RND family efflux transporter MFP subunit
MKNILIILILLLAAACREKAPVKSTDDVATVRVTEIIADYVSMPVRTAGILFSEEEMKLSFKTGGIVSKIRVREGEAVKKGAVLALLNMSEINAQVSLANTAFEKALRDLARTKNLYADSVATLEQYQNAQSALEAAKSNLEVAKFNRAHSSVAAPGNGKVLKILVKENEIAAPGYPVILFGTAGKNWKVKCSLSDRDYVRVSEGDSSTVSFDAWPGVVFPAYVSLTGEIANPATGTYEAELSVDGKGYKLASGFIASAQIFPSDLQSVNLLPLGSVVEADGDTGYVFAVTDSLTTIKLPVSFSGVSGSMISVKTLPEGIRWIVSSGAAYLRGGEKVKITK